MLEEQLAPRLQGRRLRVFERGAGLPFARREKRRVFSTSGGDLGARGPPGADGAAEKRVALFSGAVEVQYGGGWLGARVELWRESDNEKSFRSVEGVAWYDAQRGCCCQTLPRLSVVGTAEVAGADVVTVLESAMRELVESFRAANVKLTSELEDPRARFEYELLQHYPELDVVVLESQVRFVLPLLTEEATEPSTGEDSDMLGGAFLPSEFSYPAIEYGLEKTVVAFELVAPDLKRTHSDATSNEKAESQWRVTLSWASELRLSSQITQTACTPNARMSSVDIIASYKQAFVRQWTKRRDFIGALRDRVMVLEYDPVDFSRAFFMFQEQLDASAPLQIVVLSLEFSPEFFLTRCLADLHVRLLDGRSSDPGDGGSGSISIALSSMGNEDLDAWESDSARLADALLDQLKSALIRHFYE